MFAQQGQAVDVGVRFFTVDQGADHAVDDQVGVAADRGCEVAVVCAVQRVVANFVGAVDRLLHRS